MREIEFRGKTPYGEWVYGSGITIGTFVYKEPPHTDFFIWSGIQWICVIKETIGQYTGLTDKYNKKIFEGDILHSELWACNHTVEWRSGGFILVQGETDYVLGISLWLGINLCEVDGRFIRDKHYEVIGNIHDNPEFLK